MLEPEESLAISGTLFRMESMDDRFWWMAMYAGGPYDGTRTCCYLSLPSSDNNDGEYGPENCKQRNPVATVIVNSIENDVHTPQPKNDNNNNHDNNAGKSFFFLSSNFSSVSFS